MIRALLVILIHRLLEDDDRVSNEEVSKVRGKQLVHSIIH